MKGKMALPRRPVSQNGFFDRLVAILEFSGFQVLCKYPSV
jgi:hypothetical protein